VMTPSLRKNGNIRRQAGGFRAGVPISANWGSETKSNARKAGISGPILLFSGSPTETPNGWLGWTDFRLEKTFEKSRELQLFSRNFVLETIAARNCRFLERPTKSLVVIPSAHPVSAPV
jgi:hypothetical protein